MNATEIQKKFIKEENPKSKNKIKSTILKLKRKRDKSKPKNKSLKSKKSIKKKIPQNKKMQNSFSDDVSLDTNSTLISLDEDSNSNYLDMLQYIDEIELALRDIFSRGITFRNLKNFIKYENGQFKEKSDNVKFLT